MTQVGLKLSINESTCIQNYNPCKNLFITDKDFVFYYYMYYNNHKLFHTLLKFPILYELDDQLFENGHAYVCILQGLHSLLPNHCMIHHQHHHHHPHHHHCHHHYSIERKYITNII